jgi:hypothetical protein
LVDVTAEQMVVTPIAALGGTAEVTELRLFDPAGHPVTGPIVIKRD